MAEIRVPGEPHIPINLGEEECRCGHLRESHEDTVAMGHGACTAGWSVICRCPKYTFARGPEGGYRYATDPEAT